MNVTIKKCDIELLPKLLSLVDTEFIYNKGRTVSLATRYPNLFSKNNLDNVFVACSGGTVAATTSVRKFILHSDGRSWSGAMIGLVCTASDARGRGLGSHVMDSIVDECKNTDVDFLVLWTGINGFYERLGWVTEDEGAIGKINLELFYSNDALIDPLNSTKLEFDWIESIRKKYLSRKVLRCKDDYSVIPPSVDFVDFFLYKRIGFESYAIVGRRERTSFIYEMVGNQESFPVLLHSIGKHVDSVFINDNPNSVSGQWLTKRKCVQWQSQNQTMWYKLSDCFSNVSCKGLYIPYFDRI